MDYKIYPLGIVAARNTTVDNMDGEPSKAIDTLFNQYFGTSSGSSDKAIRLRIIKEVKTLIQDNFGEIDNWLIAQFRDANISDRVRDFLIDTIRFLRTGRRNIDIISWPYLLQQDAVAGRRYVDVQLKQDALIKSLERNDETFYLDDWLKHNDGFRDMIWSMKLLFGDIRGMDTLTF